MRIENTMASHIRHLYTQGLRDYEFMAVDYERDAQELTVSIEFLEKLSEALNA